MMFGYKYTISALCTLKTDPSTDSSTVIFRAIFPLRSSAVGADGQKTVSWNNEITSNKVTRYFSSTSNVAGRSVGGPFPEHFSRQRSAFVADEFFLQVVRYCEDHSRVSRV